jgi:hypothetical protein
VGLERSPLSHVSITEKLFERKSSGSGLENGEYGRRGSAALRTRHPSIHKKLTVTSLTRGSRSRNQATEFSLVFGLPAVPVITDVTGNTSVPTSR